MSAESVYKHRFVALTMQCLHYSDYYILLIVSLHAVFTLKKKSRHSVVYSPAHTICIKMELQKLSALALLVMAFVAHTCASPIAQPKLRGGYVESGECKVLEARGENFKVVLSGVTKLGHTGARALATGGCAPPVQALLKIIGAECTVINRELGAKSAQRC